jgi:hypothetical protein
VTVFVINKDLHAAGSVTIAPSKSMGRAHLLMIEAPSITSQDVSYGSTIFNNNTGLLSQEVKTTKVNPNASGAYSILLPNASIAILTIGPTAGDQ